MDKVIKESEPSRISARWHVENSDGLGSLTIRGGERRGERMVGEGVDGRRDDGDGSFTVERLHGRLLVAVAGGSDQELVAGSFDSPNKEHPFIFVDVADADSLLEAFKVMVGVPLRPEEPDPVVDFARDGSKWTIQVQKSGLLILVRAFDEGALPEFDVHRNDFR